MNDDKKIDIPQDLQGVPATVQKDPEVQAEEKKNRIWHLRLERYKEVATAIGFFLQTFKAEAVSLMSGLGTLVLGWYQLKKWVLTGRKDVKKLEHKETKVESIQGPSKSRAEHPVIGQVQGYGSGSGRLGGSQRANSAAVKPMKTKTPVIEETSGVPIDLSHALDGSDIPTMFTDSATYVWVGLLVTFGWSSLKALAKKKAKAAENVKGGS